MNTIHERDERDLALLLDLPDESAARADAVRRLAEEPEFSRAFEKIQETVRALESLGADIHALAGEVDIVAEVNDAVCHLNWEALEGAKRPFYGAEDRLETTAQALTALAPSVDLVDAVIESTEASEKTDVEVELPFAPLTNALNALGDDMAGVLPTVDLLESVMGQLPQASERPANVVPLHARPVVLKSLVPSRSRAWLRYGAAVAAAILCVAAAWWVYQQDVASVPDRQIAELDESLPASPQVDTNDDGEIFRLVPEKDDIVVAAVPDTVEAPSEPSGRQRVAPKKSVRLTLQEAINERRRALINNLDTFEQLASLSADEAARMIQGMDLSPEALLGAAQFLSPEAAAEVFRQALLNDPDNEALKYALARSLAGNPDNASERQDQLEGLLALNERNSLPHYMLAADYMARGEVELGLEALARGASLSEASPYTLESMRQREAVLRASGLDADTASYLALSMGGETEVGDIAALRSELLNYGDYYEQQGDTDTAQQIYNAVNELGMQLEEGADMAVVEQAGLETQQDAMDALQGIFEVLQQPDTVAVLGDTIGLLAQSILEVTRYIDSAQNVVNNPQSTSTEWSALIQQIFASGDRDIANLVGQ